MHTRTTQKVRQAALNAALFMLYVTPAFAGDAAAPAAPAKNAAVKLEAIAGSSVKRITLTPKAFERLGIETGTIGQEVVIRKQMVSGMVVYPQASAAAPAPGGAGFGTFRGAAAAAGTGSLLKTIATAPTPPATNLPGSVAPRGESMVVVSLSSGEFERLAKDRPARITPLYSRDKEMGEMSALLSDAPPIEDAKRSMLALHYKLPSSAHGLAPSTRVRVELQLAGSEDKQKVVPYNAVYYDAKGAPWVYVATGPVNFERQRITVHRVVGNQAVLSAGPEAGTKVVTVGAALLYGTEIFGK